MNDAFFARFKKTLQDNFRPNCYGTHTQPVLKFDIIGSMNSPPKQDSGKHWTQVPLLLELISNAYTVAVPGVELRTFDMRGERVRSQMSGVQIPPGTNIGYALLMSSNIRETRVQCFSPCGVDSPE
ncbi:hypothetical protein CSKR_108008 [Clonorchis sinensis]|uniref:Uncharacterized protein n=1 Tax=Clonorchis sinensis TaxID=79923 RepID=A0A3R7G078_CLOSI|nr:hypothetical protein CSKR_108008 [Clonorchis sinensis]